MSLYEKSFGGRPTVPTTRDDLPEFLRKNCKCLGKWVPIPKKKKEAEPYLVRETRTR